VNTRRLFLFLVAMAVAVLPAACGGGSEDSQATSTSVTPSSSSTSTTVLLGTTSTTSEPHEEPPVIHLAGYTAVYSQDGNVGVSGWLDRPADVTVGGTPADVRDDPVSGLSTFDAALDLEPGSHAVTISATDAMGLSNEIVLSVLVDPTLEVQIAYIQDVDPVERSLVADYVEFLTGDEATVAAREDGAIGEDEELPGGFYLRNRNPRLRTLTLGDLGAVTLQACFPGDGPCVVEEAVDVDAWVDLMSNPGLAEERFGWSWYGDASLPYWITLQDGIVVQISEQYLP
jgi:hypothetical protein